MPLLRIGFVPEHFSAPLHFATTHFSLSAHLIPFPSGTGHMAASLRAGELDVAIGLTEGWVAALAPSSSSSPSPASTSAPASEQAPKEEVKDNFKLVGTYVESPLCWAVSTGKGREDVCGMEDLRPKGEGGKKVLGVSRVGSGSFVMGFVVAGREGWWDSSFSASSSSSASGEGAGAGPEPPFEVRALGNFEELRKGVSDDTKTADFFLWEHFTSSRYYAPEASPYPIKKIGEIYTPWSSWKIVAKGSLVGSEELEEVFAKVNSGVRYFEGHREEAVGYITSELDYGEGDAREWLGTVRFAEDVRGVRRSVVEMAVETLKKAGVLKDDGVRPLEEFVGIMKEE
ncbi:MAG: hypothetical protein Q9219_006888 [cf. Caloplaca sp. 3 TL-2023]